MFRTDPEDPRTEAAQVAAWEARNHRDAMAARASKAQSRPHAKPLPRSRISLHINWDDNNEAEMLYCEAFRLLPRGMSRKVILRFLDFLVGDCKDTAEVARMLTAWVRVKEAEARGMMGARGQAATFKVARPERSSRKQAEAQTPMLQRDFLRAMYDAPAPQGYKWGLVADTAALLKQAQAVPEPAAQPAPPAWQPPQPSWEAPEPAGYGAQPTRRPPQPATRRTSQQALWGLGDF